MKDYLLCIIKGRRCALDWHDIERQKLQQQAEWSLRVQTREVYEQQLYERLQGDTRTFHDMEEAWNEIEEM